MGIQAPATGAAVVKNKGPLPPEAGPSVCLPSRASLGRGSFEKRLILRPFGELVTHLPQLVGDGFYRAFIRQAFAPESIEPEIKAAVDHVQRVPERCRARYPYNYE